MKVNVIVAVFFICLISVCGGSSSGNYVAQNPSSAQVSSSSSSAYNYLGKVQTDLSITSSITGVTYPYHIYFPYGYETSGKKYPVIYGTDAQWIFPYFSQTLDLKNKDVIFVGIEEGPKNSDRRAIDFLPQGAPSYINFLKNEFIPLIEKNYRVSSERTYVGTSYGGLLGSILLTKEPVGEPYFKNYMLFDGSFGTMQAMNIQDEETRFNASKKLNLTLILTSANPGNVLLVNAYQARYENRHYEGLTIHRRSYNVPHVEIGNPSFYDNIDLLY